MLCLANTSTKHIHGPIRIKKDSHPDKKYVEYQKYLIVFKSESFADETHSWRFPILEPVIRTIYTRNEIYHFRLGFVVFYKVNVPQKMKETCFSDQCVPDAEEAEKS